MPDTVRVIISDEPPGSEFADTVPVERVKPCPLTVATSTSSLYVMVMVSAESTEAAVIRGGGAMLFATAAATKLAREFGWDAVSSMLPVLLEYARLMTSSLSGSGNYIIITKGDGSGTEFTVSSDWIAITNSLVFCINA